MKIFFPIQKFNLRFQIDRISPKKVRLFEEYNEIQFDTDLCIILIKQRENKMISDG